ncbi:alanine/glycine:cation symporter family protein [Garciella nitratireducens]|uniref:alanine/glycine:cation symporter family protein n=1 Tax=Garciella nitratireducens TaxID=218205 RepID=UPI003B5A5A79
MLLESIVSTVNSILWDYILIVALVGTGIIISIRLGFPQIRRFAWGAKKVFGGVFKKGGNREGSMSSFQALATAIAAQIGTGNIAGVATAITLGGPGAVFWMWVSAFFGMSTIFVEATLAQKYRETTENGQLVGGPAYYIKNGLGSKSLASFFAVSIILALGFIGNMVQSNSIADVVSRAFPIPQLGIGVIIAFFAALIFIGGMKRIASFTETIVPIMAMIYIIGSILILILFRQNIIFTLKAIFTGAFSSKSILGGAAGVGMQQAIRYGVARGLFSNEAGMGSTPNSHAVADVEHPAEQGLSAMIAVCIDTMLVCTATTLIILTTGAQNLGAEGAGVTQEAFNLAFGPIGQKFLAICLTFFAFTTIIGWYYFGENNIRFLFKGKKAIRIYQVIVLIFIILGSFQKVDLVWSLADMFNGIMVIPNLIGVLFLFKESKAILKDYDSQILRGEKLHYKYEYENNELKDYQK